jgi:hypothetical protein
MPKEYAKLDFGRAIQKMKEITAQSGRSTGNDQAEAIANHHQVDVYA